MLREFERNVLGSDFGNQGHTSVEEADELTADLGLVAGSCLLDLGSGTGWPGLYMAARTGCRVVLADLPDNGLRAGLRRAERREIDNVLGAVASSGSHVPLRREAFDAVVHSDVLCCLGAKRATLRSTARVLRSGGKTAFSVIHPSRSLTEHERRRVRQFGPPYCTTRAPYPDLLASAGFVEVAARDVTARYFDIKVQSIAEADRLGDRLHEVLGAEEFDRLQTRRRETAAMIADGVLRRSIFTATRGITR